MKLSHGKYYPKHHCVECNTELTSNDRLYNKGVCPYCGRHTPGTICNTSVESFRDVYKVYFGFIRIYSHSEKR